MKKFLSLILTAAMLLSLVIIVNLPVSAVDGMWTTVARPSFYDDADEEEYTPPTELGYEYTSEGFKTINADWTDSCPFQTIASKDPVNFEEGIYMQFRIDAYDFSVGPDKWVSVSFWDSSNISQGSTDRGSGISTLIRPTPLDDGTWEYNHINWYNNEWTNQGYSNGNVIKVNDEPLLFEVELKIVDGLYELYINGAPAPALVNSTFVDKFVDGEAYILITLHNTKVGSDIGITITKFGTSKATATVPQGDDKKEPINVEREEKAPIADPSTVPENMPAILMTGNREMSDADSFGAGQGDDYQINDDFTVRIIDTTNDIWTTTTWRVKNSVSYDIDDFPVMCFLTKNFCTCDDPTDCYATEECKIYLLYGENIAPAGNNVTPEIDICWEPIIIEEGEKAGQYLYFWYDSSTDAAKAIFDAEGRIHGVRLDFSRLQREAGRNVVTIDWVGFFRSVDEAEAFITSYLGVSEEETTEVITEATTEAPVVTTEAPTEEKTEAPTEEKTEAPTEAKTEAKTEALGDDQGKTDGGKTDGGKSGGCGGVVGGAFAVVALVAACGAVVLRKKED